MLTEEDKSMIRAGYADITTRLPGFKPRPQQLAMIAQVANAIADGVVALVEAPTGTGKSMSYLLGSIPVALNRKKRVVVSTATASLQDQLSKKDLPEVLGALQASGMGDVTYVVAKGRERHLCPSKLQALTQQVDMFSVNEKMAEILAVEKAWKGGEWDGIRDSLPQGVRPVVWMDINNTAATCVGQACAEYEGCPYYDTMARIEEADVIVTNHDYLLANLANVPKSVLCDTENNVYLFDEGHHLGDKCLSAFSKTFSLSDDIRPGILKIAGMMKQPQSLIDVQLERCYAMQQVVANNSLTLLGDGTQHRFVLGEVPPHFLGLIEELMGCYSALLDAMVSMTDSFNESTKKGPQTQMISMLANTEKATLMGAIDCLMAFLDESFELARWISKSKTSVELKCSPFESGAIAKKYIWSRIKTAVITSATLQSLGSYAACLRSLGLPADTRATSLTTPLDYSKAQLIVPTLSLDSSQQGHSEMIFAFVRQEAIHTLELGILVYFTSRSQMMTTYNGLSELERSMVLLQGNLQPSAMIAAHKTLIDSGRKSILFGLDSLAEGIDLPGAYCTRVIITRLPFPNPSDPVLATHSEVLERKGLSSFPLLMLPLAGRKFAQIVGRLIRKEGDYGIVFVLDQRLTSKSYGGQLLKGTPFLTIDRNARKLPLENLH